jgi:UPF0755 protein
MRGGVKRFFIFLTGLFLAAVSAGVWVYRDLDHYAQGPAGNGKFEKRVTLRSGQGLDSMVAVFCAEGIVSDALRFKITARLKGYDRKLKAGEYLLSPELTPIEILEKLASGDIYLHRFTVPEGYTLRQIAALTADAGLGDPETFLRLAGSEAFIQSKQINAKSLEGYLFPDTYYFPQNPGEEVILSTMIRRFHSIFNPEWRKRAAQLNLSVHGVVTLASIIEKETGAIEEMPVISSVFHNRLKKNMRLESDPTVIYGILDFDGNLTRKHLETLTPYNTYRIEGLPPGPIANPGREALAAALYPADTPFLFFVSKGDKTHYFSSTLKEHNQAVRAYQLSR